MTQLGFDPFTNPGALDVLEAGGRQNPGLFILEDGADREYNWDIKMAPGIQGVYMTYRGWKPTLGIGFRFVFWEQGQVDEFYQEFLPMFQLDGNKFGTSIKPVAVTHPVLNANDIFKVTTAKIGRFTGNSQTGWSVKIIVNEFRVAKPVPATSPSGATTEIGRLQNVASKLRSVRDGEIALAERPL